LARCDDLTLSTLIPKVKLSKKGMNKELAWQVTMKWHEPIFANMVLQRHNFGQSFINFGLLDN
jgi:hypothetical protein